MEGRVGRWVVSKQSTHPRDRKELPFSKESQVRGLQKSVSTVRDEREPCSPNSYRRLLITGQRYRVEEVPYYRILKTVRIYGLVTFVVVVLH